MMPFFIPFSCVTLCQFYSINSPVLFTKNNKFSNERKEDFLYLWLLQCITLYQRRQKIASLDIIAFLVTYICINNPYWQSSRIIIFLCRYYIVTSDARICSWKCFSCCQLLYCQSFIRYKMERLSFRKKVNRRTYVEDITFKAALPPSYVIFCCFLCVLRPPSQVMYLLKGSC